MNLVGGPPAPPSRFILALLLTLAAPLPPPTLQITPNITVSLSFSAGSHKDTNACQSDPKQKRKEDPSGGTLFSNEAQIKRSQTNDPND